MRDDRPSRGDRQLLSCGLEDKRPEGIERRKLIHPGPWAEVRPCVDQPREYRINLPKELPRLGIGNRGALSGRDVGAHALSEANRLSDEDDVDAAGGLLVDLENLPDPAVLPIDGERSRVFERPAVLVDPLPCCLRVGYELLRPDDEMTLAAPHA